MRDLSTLAKLLAEEDIHVVHRQQSTAMFDVKNRELSLPIWKEMSKDIQDLMTIHEVGHALWTPLEQLEKAHKENIEFTFVNVLEDIRIEKKVQDKYLGSVRIFNRGYQELIGSNFFGTKGKDISHLNLIDKINLHYKHYSDVKFSDEEMVWVEKSNQTVTPDDVLELAKELYEYIQNNPQSQAQNPAESGLEDHIDAMMAPSGQSNQEENSDDSEENMEGSGSSSDENSDSSEEASDNSSGKTSGEESSEEDSEEASSDSSEETKENASTNSEKSDDKSDNTSEVKENVAESQADGGHGEKSKPITATTDSSSKEASKEMLDTKANDRLYAFIPKINMKEAIVDHKTIMNIWNKWYTKVTQNNMRYFDKSLSELDTFTKDNKKTVSYMVKEFEMKKAADQYARASTSKTGSLDMGRLHTYKYNDDLFKKVTTLPGATNHGLVLFLDWSGSMAHNLQGTLNQLYNLIWFCKRTQIPFEVFAFTDQYDKRNENEITSFKSGDLIIEGCNLLQFFSSKMNNKDLYKMMHNLNMYAGTWIRENYFSSYNAPDILSLGGTPLGQAAAFALDFVPKYKKETGVQKINTVFLTDGSGCRLDRVHYVNECNYKKGKTYNGYQYVHYHADLVLKDNMTNTTIFAKDYNKDTTAMLLELLRKRVPEMNVVNFFVAGTGRSGRVCKHAVSGLIKDKSEDYFVRMKKAKEILKKINKEKATIEKNIIKSLKKDLKSFINVNFSDKN